VTCQKNRSQHKNRAMARRNWRAPFELEKRKKKEELEKFSKDKKEMAVGQPDSSLRAAAVPDVKDHPPAVESAHQRSPRRRDRDSSKAT